MSKHTYKKTIAIFLMAVMVVSLTACGNKLEKDLKEAKKIVEDSEEQEDKIKQFLENVVGIDTSEYDLTALEDLKDVEELSDLSDEESADENADKDTEDKDKDTEAKAGKDSDSKDKKKSSGKFKDYASGKYAELMSSGEYYIEYTAYVWGIEGSSKTAVDGTNSSSISEMMGYSTWSLILDGYQYDIDMAQKIYTKTEVADIEATLDGMQVDYSDMEFVESSNGEIPGMSEVSDFENGNYDYDEFQIVMNMGAEDSVIPVPIRFYMDGNDLYAIWTQTMGIDSVMIIESISEDVPAEMFELPDDYSEVDSLY